MARPSSLILSSCRTCRPRIGRPNCWRRNDECLFKIQVAHRLGPRCARMRVPLGPVRQHVWVYATQLVSLPRSVGTGSPVPLPFQPRLGWGSRRFTRPQGLERSCTITAKGGGV